MKAKIVIGIAFAASSLVASAQDGDMTFSGSVWEDGGTRQFFQLKAAPGETKRIDIRGGRTVEVTRDAAGESVIRLVDPQGQQLHSATTPSGTGPEKTFTYAFCENGTVTYLSPLSQEASVCPKSDT